VIAVKELDGVSISPKNVSDQDIFYNVCFFDSGESSVEASELYRESAVIDPQAVQNGCVEVSQVHWLFDDVVAKVIGEAIFHAALYSTTGQPNAKASTVMIATHRGVTKLALTKDGSTELDCKDDECVFEHS